MAEKNPNYYCVRQCAGPLVKESRALRPRLSPNDTPYERTEKNRILKPPGDSSVCRSRVDRLELYLALFSSEGSFYSLTFDDEDLPKDFHEARNRWRSFLRRLRLWHKQPFDYAYSIEGKHGDHRYHIHLVARDSDFSPTTIRALWRFGNQVDNRPLLINRADTYRRTAIYMSKEATDGVTIPISARTWVVSASLRNKLPPTEYFRSTSGRIHIPKDVRCSGSTHRENAFGSYQYAWYIKAVK